MFARAMLCLLLLLSLMAVACQPTESVEVTRVVEVTKVVEVEVLEQVEVTRLVEVSELVEVTRVVEVTVQPEPEPEESATESQEDEAFDYQWSRTDVRYYSSETNGRDYKIYVSLPNYYDRDSSKTYSVVYVTDGDLYTIPVSVSASVMARPWADENMPEVIVVGIGYDGSLAAFFDRRKLDLGSEGHESFLQFLQEELIPDIEADYRVDPSVRTLMGHSMGGAFSIYALFNAPETFGQIVALSPSMYPSGDADLDSSPVRFFLAVGTKGELDELYLPRVRAFHEELEANEYDGLDSKLSILSGETHFTTPQRAFTTGMKWLFSESN